MTSKKDKDEILEEEREERGEELPEDAVPEEGDAEEAPGEGEEAEASEAGVEAPEEGAGEEAPRESEEDEAIKEKYLRLMADFQNYKRRVEKERSDVHAFANEKIVTELLAVMDNFERALDHDEGEGYKEGIALIFDQLKEVLRHSGVEEIETEDADFDPNFHNAVLMEETEEVESGKVSEVLQKGYTLHGKLIRPAMVKVAK